MIGMVKESTNSTVMGQRPAAGGCLRHDSADAHQQAR